MSTATVPDSADQALDVLECAMRYLADADPAQLSAEALARQLRTLERIDAVEAAARGKLLAAFDARDLHLADGQRTTRAWLVNTTGITKARPASTWRWPGWPGSTRGCWPGCARARP